jgi:voltage-gated potassium channel
MTTQSKFNTRNKLYLASTTLMAWIVVGTFVFYRLEDWTRIEAFYFSVVTITTVGYGDLAPTSDLSRLFTAVYILVGVSIGIATLGYIGSEILQNRERKYTERIIKNNNS